MFSSNNQEKKTKVEDFSNVSSSIGRGTSVEGNVETVGNIRIEGNVKGNVTCKAKTVLGESSYIEGIVAAQNAEIAGEIQGSIEVSELLILRPTAVIHGDIITNKLVVESGATFNGSCRMGVTISEITFENESRPITTRPAELSEESEGATSEESEESESRSV